MDNYEEQIYAELQAERAKKDAIMQRWMFLAYVATGLIIGALNGYAALGFICGALFFGFCKLIAMGIEHWIDR